MCIFSAIFLALELQSAQSCWVSLRGGFRQMQLMLAQPRDTAHKKALINNFARLCWKLGNFNALKIVFILIAEWWCTLRIRSIYRACQIKTIWMTRLLFIMISWEGANDLCRLFRLAFKAFPKLLLCLVSHCSRWSFYLTSNKMLSDSRVCPWLSYLLWCCPISDSLLPGYKIRIWVKTNITFALIIDCTLHTFHFYIKMLPILHGWS